MLLNVLGFQGDGALRAHQWFARLVPREGMLGIAFRARKEVFFTGDVTGSAFAAKFLLRFVSDLAPSS
jgi:hypothetical protein